MSSKNIFSNRENVYMQTKPQYWHKRNKPDPTKKSWLLQRWHAVVAYFKAIRFETKSLTSNTETVEATRQEPKSAIQKSSGNVYFVDFKRK